MKKYSLFLFSVAVMAFTACSDKKGAQESTGNDTETQNSNAKTAMLEVNETIPMDEKNPESPQLSIEISLPAIKTGNADADKRIENRVADVAFQAEESSLTDAVRNFTNETKEMYHSDKEFYYSMIEDGYGTASFNHSYSITGEIEKGYKGYVNYIIHNESYSGGAHPNAATTAICFDPATGMEVAVNDIFKEECNKELKEFIKAVIAEHFDCATFQEVINNGYLFDNDIYISNNFILGNEKTVFIYNPYDIAPYAAGEIIVEIPNEKIKHMMK